MSDITRAGELFGERLRELRKKRGMTQVMLAEATGVKQSHVSSMERGTLLPNLLTLLRLAAALDCKVSALVTVFDKEDVVALLPR
ncbi:MAG TPA: helix-turn-helix transcriptional regulator [Thermoanaerobaculia bacterium]